MATLVLRPESDYSVQQDPDGASPNYACVNEVNLDDNTFTKCVPGSSGNRVETDIFGFPNHTSQAGIISNVTISAFCDWLAAGKTGASVRLLVRLGSTNYYSSSHALTDRGDLFSWSLDSKPSDSSAWTWTDIDNLLAGDEMTSVGASKSNQRSTGCCDQLYVTVTYTPPPAAPTNVSATENLTDKITITWTAGDGETNGHRVYRDGNDISGVVSHGTSTYDDTGAAAPAITAGSASASNGTFSFKVVCSNSGESIANGTTYSYTVKAINDGGTSSASSADNGYRLAGSLSYQWQVSAGDSDADYSDIAGATSSTFTFYDAPSGVGRYYRCKLTASNSTTQYSTAERGYRVLLTPIVII